MLPQLHQNHYLKLLRHLLFLHHHLLYHHQHQSLKTHCGQVSIQRDSASCWVAEGATTHHHWGTIVDPSRPRLVSDDRELSPVATTPSPLYSFRQLLHPQLIQTLDLNCQHQRSLQPEAYDFVYFIYHFLYFRYVCHCYCTSCQSARLYLVKLVFCFLCFDITCIFTFIDILICSAILISSILCGVSFTGIKWSFYQQGVRRLEPLDRTSRVLFNMVNKSDSHPCSSLT